MTIKIGNLEQIYFVSLFIKNDEEAIFDAQILSNSPPMRVSIVFVKGEDGQEGTVGWETKNGSPHFIFKGWSNSLGACTPEPVKFGDVGRKKLYFQAANHFISDTYNLLNFFILMGDSDA